MSRGVSTLLTLVLLGVAPAALAGQAPARAARFEITAVGDTTLSFRTGPIRWVKPGQSGTAVDPRKRDALVARFRVLSVRDGDVVALVTGQTTAVSTDHVATVTEPGRSWVKSKSFWSGLLVGGAIGALAVGASSK